VTHSSSECLSRRFRRCFVERLLAAALAVTILSDTKLLSFDYFISANKYENKRKEEGERDRERERERDREEINRGKS